MHKYILLTFVINRFFMKLFNTNNIEIVKCCQQEFCFSLPSITFAHRTDNFLGKIRQCENLLVKRLLFICKILYFMTLRGYRYIFSSHASLSVIACAFGLLCFICCFLVKLYILFNRLILTVLYHLDGE